MIGERDASRVHSETTNAHAVPVHAVRGSLIAASLESLRQLGKYEPYLQRLDPSFREQVLFCLASSWVPVEAALAHYAAQEALSLSASELSDVGDMVSERVAGAFLGSLQRTSRAHSLTASPWIPLREYRRMCDRLLRGGAIDLRELGEKEAELSIGSVPMLRFQAFRSTMFALTRHAVGAFALRAFVRELRTNDPEQLHLLVRWL
ncbi:MAG TPA: hypothetical protein VI299_08520 [Polyangiales bacterium]